MRLINADALNISALIEEDPLDDLDTGWNAAVDRVTKLVENAPTIEAEPVKRAEWIEDGYRDLPCVCSHCGEEAPYKNIFKKEFAYDYKGNLQLTGVKEIREYTKTDRCPNCGAKMTKRGEKK